MAVIHKYLSKEDLDYITPEEFQWLKEVFESHGGFPSLEKMWALMDQVWVTCGCDQVLTNDCIATFYRHPVWLLNGLFIEQHQQSLYNRELFKNYIVKRQPKQIAEFGGGFGTLARMIAALLPSSKVDVIEPHPHPLAVAKAEKTVNVRYCPKLDGEYDVLIATDVFEHVLDPLQLVYETAQYLREGGCYLIANCFYPVIRCHLPQTFHFRHSWDIAMKAMGLQPADHVAYGRVYLRQGELDLEAARHIEVLSQYLWSITQHLPNRLATLMSMALYLAR